MHAWPEATLEQTAWVPRMAYLGLLLFHCMWFSVQPGREIGTFRDGVALLERALPSVGGLETQTAQGPPLPGTK